MSKHNWYRVLVSRTSAGAAALFGASVLTLVVFATPASAQEAPPETGEATSEKADDVPTKRKRAGRRGEAGQERAGQDQAGEEKAKGRRGQRRQMRKGNPQELPPRPDADEAGSRKKGKRGPGGRGPQGDQAGRRRADGQNLDRLMNMLQKLDTNGDGVLSRDEAPERLQQRWERLDSNGDDQITRDEVTAAIQKMRERMENANPDGANKPGAADPGKQRRQNGKRRRPGAGGGNADSPSQDKMREQLEQPSETKEGPVEPVRPGGKG